jgi:peptide/nickel transport system permease protein
MVADGVAAIAQQSWLIWPPGLAIALTILALGILGDSVRDVSAERWTTPVRVVRRRSASSRAVSESHAADPAEMLVLRGVTVGFPSPSGGTTTVVDDVSFAIGVGEAVGLVGESGCGKTMTAMAILGQLPASGSVEAGGIIFQGRDLAPLGERDLRRIRGRSIGFVSQEPMIGLNPGYRIGWQLAEVVRRHHGGSRRAARARAVELLAQVDLSDPASVARRYPHELSGGMAQRVAIARALAGDPSLLIADEPTTALDVTVQTEILGLLRGLQAERQMSILLVTHDWGVAVETCSRIVVMYAGQVVEVGDSVPLVRDPQHPYTKALLASNPQLDAQRGQLPMIPGSVPAPGAWPPGCRFEPRCDLASEACRVQPVPIRHVADGREARCVLAEGAEDE